MKSDRVLQQDVIDELRWEPSVDADGVNVTVMNGVVTLDGEVCTMAEKTAAEQVTRRVSGVKGTSDQLKVIVAETSARTDGDIFRAIDASLEWSSSVPEDAIVVQVDEGWVRLTGSVEWEFQRQAAMDCVRRQRGVAGVSDAITIEPKLSSALVGEDIEAALRRRAVADAHEITVHVLGSEVILSGTVDNWSERELAMSSAWATPGVRSVVDQLALRDR